ncbi:MAG: choice-of-anchor Q domain-containing protein, partial [Saprospiraceae bacterium]
MKFNLWLATPFCLFVAPLSAQTIRYVNHNASGSADGSSWANAFIRVQQALAVAQDGDEIWIAKGTYKPTTTNDRYARYDLPSGVAVYGGFAGTETQREQRDWTANLTILSGDIGVPGDSTDNSFNVLYAYSPNDKTRLDGLVFEEGNATNDDINIDYHRPTRSGGGIYLDGENFGYAQLSVVNCTIRRNRALYQGGGIYANGRSGGMAIIRLDNCLFEMNTSQTFGGGFSIENDFAQPFAFEAKGCTFTQNYCGWGAAMFLQCHQAVSFSKCAFNQNESVGGTTIHFEGTGYKDPISFTDCTFKNNTSGETIVWLLYAPEKRFPISISRCNFESNKGTPLAFFAPNGKYSLTVDHSKFLLNGNNQDGTGVYAASASLQETSAVFSNCLFYKGYAIEFSGKVDSVVNSILIADNFNHNIAYGASGIYLKNCLFSHLSCANLGSNVICGPTNLFGLDPLFVNPSASDFHLQACSPAINAGNNAILDSLGIKTDLDGNPRIRNGVSDLGPYETNVSLHPGVATEPACAGASDGAIVFNPDICLPFNFEWSNGTTTGNNTEGLSAGTYVFTAIGSNNIPVSDTLVIADPEPMVISTKVEDVLCYGEPGGYVETTV